MPLRPSSPEALTKAINRKRDWQTRSAKKAEENRREKAKAGTPTSGSKPPQELGRRAKRINQVSPKKAKQLRDEKPKKDFVKTYPCLVCGATGVDPHHEPFESQGGTAKDLSPLCRWHHTLGPTSRHELGSLERFEDFHGVDVIAENERIEREFQERQAA